MLINLLYIAVALFALGFSIFIHELGHFLAAKRRGLVADRFSIGFGPRLFGWHRNGTDFRVSLIPFGGYVSLPQLADMGRIEGGEGEEAQQLPPISYADKMIVAVMGAVFNLIFAFLLSLLLWGFGREIIKSTEISVVAEEIVNSEGEPVPGPAHEAGLKPGDTIVAVDGNRVGSWMQLQNAIMTGTRRDAEDRPLAELTVLRDGERRTVEVRPRISTSETIRRIGIAPGKDRDAAPEVLRVDKDMPAHEAGMRPGDRLLALDGEPVVSSAFLSSYLAHNGDKVIEVTIERDGGTMTLPIKPEIKEGENTPRFGFAYHYPPKKVRVHRNPVEQIGLMVETMRMTLVALVHTGSNVKVRNMSGPVGIVHGLTAMARYGPMDLIWFLALINVNLAIINLLPVPVLDGGHMLFATIDKVAGRPLPRRFLESVQGAFMVLLLAFLLYVTFFDIGRVGRDMGLIEDNPGETNEAPAPDKRDTDGASAPDNSKP